MRILIVLSDRELENQLAESLNEQAKSLSICWLQDVTKVKQLKKNDFFDLVVTDILLESEEGLGWLQGMVQQKKTRIVFLTDMNFLHERLELALYSFDLANTVVLKELGLPWLLATLEELIRQAQLPHPVTEKLLVTEGDSIQFLNPEEIIFIEKMGKNLVVHTVRKQYQLPGTLAEIVGKLPPYFYRSHRSYLVNLHKIKAVVSSGRSFLVQFFGTREQAILSYDRERGMMESL